jgi:hypothetical protein
VVLLGIDTATQVEVAPADSHTDIRSVHAPSVREDMRQSTFRAKLAVPL